MATSYQVTLQNETSSVWTLAVFIRIPNASGMYSVAWKLAGPVAGTGGTGDTSWNDTPAVCLGTASGSGTVVFKQTIARAAAVNQAWTVTKNQNVLDLTQSGASVTPGQIEITNNAGQLVNAALGYDNVAAVYSPELPSGLATGFVPQPQYWFLLAQTVQQGQVITSASTQQANIAGPFLPPQQLVFPPQQTAATVTASMSGPSFSVSITYSAIG